MRCEIVRCDACGQEILPGAPIIRVMRGLCGVVPMGYQQNQVAEFHEQCVQMVLLKQKIPVMDGYQPELANVAPGLPWREENG